VVAVLELHTEMRVTSVCFVAVNAVAAVVDDGRVWASSDPGANMTETAIAAFIYPFVLFALSICILNPAKRLVQRRMKEGLLKRVLLTPVNQWAGSGSKRSSDW